MMLINSEDKETDRVLNAIAHMPTRSLDAVVDKDFFRKLTDADFMRLATHLARKSYDEGGCPIGAVIIDNTSRAIVGKGHNTLVQDDDPYNHGETAAMRDAGRRDFSQTKLFTTLSPCDVCTALIGARGFKRVVVGDVTNASGNEDILRAKGVVVDVQEDQTGVALYRQFRCENPDLDLEDWKGLAAVNRKNALR